MRPFEPMSWDELPNSVKDAFPQDAPMSTKMMAARALLPMGTSDLAILLYHLAADSDRRIRATARRSLTSLPRELLLPLLADQISPKILHWFANRDLPDAHLFEVLVLNRNAVDETIELLARTRNEESVLNIIANNQERLLRDDAIVRALLDNDALPLATAERVRNFVEMATGRPIEEILRGPEPEPEEPLDEPVEKEDFDAETDAAFDMEESAEAVETELPTEAELEESIDLDAPLGIEVDPDLFAELEQSVDLDDLETEVFEPEEEFTVEFLLDPGRDLSSQERRSMVFRIRQLREVDKMRLAMKGNIEARQILIKSPNKMVQEAVLRNPRLTIEEVIKLTKDKTAREEIIRMITGNRDWTKNYQVVHGLCLNPKTPLPTAIKFLLRLNIRDLHSLAKSKQVPGMVSVQAKKVAAEKLRHR
ncbi:MAG: hypothetical protein P9L99_19105 [Candidatus Lernaella stagnicola]|nr:hypothetical protein [Candidatus Lernaella stagnicola]